MKKKLVTALTATLMLLSGPAYSQSKSQLVQDCLAALEEGDTAKSVAIAEEIQTWRTLFATKLILDARECLNGATGRSWEYATDLGEFVSEDAALEIRRQKETLMRRKCELRDEVASLQVQILSDQRTIDALRADFHQTVMLETVKSCQQWFEEDRRAALTNNMCNSIFLELGLPDSGEFEVMSEKQASIESAANRLEEATLELEIIEAHDMLPEDFLAQEMEKVATSKAEKIDECADQEN